MGIFISHSAKPSISALLTTLQRRRDYGTFFQIATGGGDSESLIRPGRDTPNRSGQSKLSKKSAPP